MAIWCLLLSLIQASFVALPAAEAFLVLPRRTSSYPFLFSFRQESRPCFMSSASMDLNNIPNATDGFRSTGNAEAPAAGDIQEQRTMDMPWNKAQQWALEDKVGQYTVTVSVATKDNRETLCAYVLWRSLTQDVVELAGYPLSFLIQKYMELPAVKNEMNCPISLEVLPYLDDYVFEANGGLSGRIYGIKGVEEGTRIQTTRVVDVETTLPKSFVRTADGQIVYELGQPSALMDDVEKWSGAGADGKAMAERVVSSLQKTSAASASSLLSSKQEDGKEQVLDGDLVNLAAAAAATAVGAVAMQSLAHHLTVNVFWV